MQRQLQEARAAKRVLDVAEATLRSRKRRPCEIGKVGDVVVWRIEIRMIEDIKGSRIEPQPVFVFEQELFPQTHIEARLERPSEYVASRSRKEGLVAVASRCVAGGHAVRARLNELWVEIRCVQHRLARLEAQGARL